MNPNEMLLVIPHSLLTSETIGGDIHGVSLKKHYVEILLLILILTTKFKVYNKW